MRRRDTVGMFGGLLLALVLFAGAARAAEDPVALVRKTSDRVLADVTAHKKELEKDPSGIYRLVQGTVLPYFDFHFMTRSAVGRYWRSASEAQREDLTRQFQELLVRTYATALLNYSGQPIKYPPVRILPGDTRVKIPTLIETGSGGPPIPIDYRLYLTDAGWKVYDVTVNGASLVTSYRSSFASEVRRGGVDGLIQTLAAHNKKSSG